jgi:hypothetical protein
MLLTFGLLAIDIFFIDFLKGVKVQTKKSEPLGKKISCKN